MKEKQLEFPFLQRETFYTGRSMVQLKFSFPNFFKVIGGICDQCLLPLGDISEEAGFKCVTGASLRESSASLRNPDKKAPDKQ